MREREELLLSSQQQQESVQQMQRQLMEAIQKTQEQASQQAEQAEHQIAKKYETYVAQAKHGEELMRANQNLSDTIAKVEERNRQLTQKVNSVKIYQRVFKHAISMQCKFCNIFFPGEIFIDHVKTCTKDSAGQRSLFFKIPLQVQIASTKMVQDEVDNRTYTNYVIKVKFNGQSWNISQKYKAFCSLHESLINQYPSVKFPDSSFQLA